MPDILGGETERGLMELAGRYENKRAVILPALHLCQKQFGYISEELMQQVASLLGVPPIKVLEVATFYTMFRLKKPVRHRIEVCTNVSCSLLGAQHLYDYLRRKLATDAEGVSADGNIHVSEVECLGSCGSAPVMLVDDEYCESLDEKRVDQILSSIT